MADMPHTWTQDHNGNLESEVEWEDIDPDDAPELDADWFARAERAPFQARPLPLLTAVNNGGNMPNQRASEHAKQKVAENHQRRDDRAAQREVDKAARDAEKQEKEPVNPVQPSNQPPA